VTEGKNGALKHTVPHVTLFLFCATLSCAALAQDRVADRQRAAGLGEK
jgi:hypothetical protein